ncbi:MAG: hypothetical protein J6X88_07480 [Bacteroidales bacterium]|nr:hypothetical protein [Bacteroidales bacterium]
MDESNIIYQDEIRRHMDTMRRWYKFFAVVAIVMASLYMVFAVLIFVFGGYLNRIINLPFPVQPFGVIYLVPMAIVVPAIVFLMRAAKAAKTAVALNNPASNVAFMRWSKHFWKYCGIVTIVLLSLFVVYLATAIVLAFTLTPQLP